MKKVNAKRGMSILLTATMATSIFPMSVFASKQNTEKEEVVYVNLNENGEVKEINVVNIFDTEKKGKIVDYGNYESTRNMTTTDKIESSGDEIEINASKEKLYYEGKLKSTEMPWKIEVHYYMDGKEYSADELEGRNGKAKITISIKENESYKGDFYDSYALQTSLSLDTDKFKNIEAPAATIANVGKNKQLTYTILPGKGAEIEINSDVTGFELDGISINGIPLNLNVEVDDEELMDKVDELLDAIEKVDDGTGEVKDGVSELKEGAESGLQSGAQSLDQGASQLQSGVGALESGGEALTSGAKSLSEGAASLDSGIQSLNSGINQVQAGLDALNNNSGELTEGSLKMKHALEQLQTALNGVSVSAGELQKLSESSSAIKTGIDTLATGTANLQTKISFEAYKAVMAQNGVDIDALQSGNTQAIDSLNNLLGQVATYEKILSDMGISTDAIAPIENQCVALANQLITLLNENNAAIEGMNSYLNGVQQGAASLTAGAEELKTNYSNFDTAIQTLVNTLTDLIYQMTELKDAVNVLVEEYEKLDTGLNSYTDGVAQVVAGYAQLAEGAGNLAEGSNTLKNGSTSLYGGTKDLLNGIVKLYDSTGTLKDGTGKLDEGVAELITGISALYDGTGELKDGTEELRTKTSDADTEIEDKVDELLDTVSGGDSEVTSFVSEKNTNIDKVQFVIKTAGITEDETEEAVETEDTSMNVREKFLDLFGLYKKN